VAAGVLLLFILGIMDLSRAVYARNVLANAAREGARYAI
jgi:Flp pilus assembly protein TadG